MCTAVSYKTRDHYFGRNLDLEYSYNECVTITPRKYPYVFRLEHDFSNHFAMIGMATVDNNYPLYYDATNEFGLSMAGLNFPGNAVYLPKTKDKYNIAPFEFIPWILSRFKTVEQARAAFKKVNLVNISYNEKYPLSPLHWILSDENESVTIEPTSEGVKVYDNPVGILTNNPPFDYHIYNLRNYLNLTHNEPVNRFSNKLDLTPYSRGMGAMGLPGDLSSSSRFIKAAFTKLNSNSGEGESESISQFFHILSSVYQQRGCVKVNGDYEKTVYSSCCNTSKGIYYYTTYENSQISAVDMFREELDAAEIITYELVYGQQIRWEN